MAEDIAVSMLTSPSVATLGDSFRGVRGSERKLNSPGVTIWLCVAFAVLRTRFVLLLFWRISVGLSPQTLWSLK